MLPGKIQNFGQHLMTQEYVGKFIIVLHISSIFSVERLTNLLRTEGSRFQISVMKSTILTEVYRSFPQSLKKNSETVPQIRPRPLPSTPHSALCNPR
jgi:hypothetical protein